MFATESKKQILIVDRDVATVEPLRHRLAEKGFTVRAIADGHAAACALAERPPHLVIIDWNMPGFAGLELVQGLRRVRTPQAMRLIILSALAEEHDVVSGLSMGADDYIVKPFSLREVVARVAAILRSRRSDAGGAPLEFDDLVLDAAANRVTARGQSLNLRGVEYRLLEFLMTHPGRTFNRTQLLSQVWDARTVDVNVQRLRKILTDAGYEAYIQTVRGFGYRFGVPGAGSALPVPARPAP